ncbi:PQQ-binding-like beta-propeller repeat protein [Umezawaea tangerina]|uniref:Putative pyrroloquinoline-quinone binding quinoprotein n=1 Tax=Umezawaea tangerina TaxID=84725 RepID=A0A2T0TML4_9PSEU|nr:PQQ-binding-like beta-propeller repeat protein [Umezawaea tangerina]PRY46851.1 putative pyrroloquinoline-quinone binding quinoprotein [Umezawaea tangerina]
MGQSEQVEDSALLAPEVNGHATPQANGHEPPPEDVLAPPPADSGEPPAHVPSRSFRTRGDFIAVALLVVVTLVAALLVWVFSDARATTSQTTSAPAPELPQVTTLPPTLAEVWRAPSGGTPSPVWLGSVVVTGDGGEVVGRDPLNGEVRWRYSRDLPLCTITAAWDKALVAYSKGTGCSEITSLNPVTGARGPQRNGDAELGTRLLSEGSHVVTTGKKFIEAYRKDDLVRSMEYGQLRAIVNPNKQPRTGCEYSSFAVTTGKVAVLERCYRDDPGDRVTILKPNPDPADTPQVISTVVLGAKNARIVAVTSNRVAVAVPGSPAKLSVFDADTGGLVADYPLDIPESDLAGDPPNGVVPITISTANVYWYTGSRTIALSLEDLSPKWTATDTIGSGSTLAGQILIPVKDGLRVLDQLTGAQIGTIPVNRQGYQGSIQSSTIGPVVLEQRGQELVALR